LRARRPADVGAGLAHDLGFEIGLRVEMIVEAAMRQAGGAHEIGDGDGLEALLAKQRVGRLRTTLRRFCSACWRVMRMAPSCD
jgi:hypothetical protein